MGAHHGAGLHQRPPSSAVVVTETGYAAASGYGTGTATADDGWGDKPGGGGYPGGDSEGGGYPGDPSSAYSSGTHYEVKDGSSGTITVGPFTLSAATPDNSTPDDNGRFSALGASVSASISFLGENVTISTGVDQALTGQQVSATVNPPAGYTALGALTNWSIATGNDVFYTYNGKAATHQLVLLSDSANYTTGPALKFYDKAAESVTIKCDTTLVGPDGVLTPVKALQSKSVAFLKPTVKWFIDTGFVQPATPGFFYLLSDPAKGYPGGENWRDINISVPQPFSGGKGCIAQLVKPDLEVLQDTAPFTLQDSNNKKKGLDNSFPYPGSLWDLPAHGNQSDRPGLGVAGLNQNGYEGYNTAFRTDNFDTWVM